MTLIGTSIFNGDVAGAMNDLAPQMVRVYNDGGLTTTLAKSGMKLAVSLKTFDAARINALLKILPTGSTISVNAEPEDDIAAQTLALDTWHSWQLQLVDLVAKSGRAGEIRVATILMTWTLEKASGRNWNTYLTPAVVSALKTLPGSICGWDAYAGHSDVPASTPTQVFGASKAIANQLGLDWGIFETGVRILPTSDLARQAEWWKAAFAYVRLNSAYCFLLWNSRPLNMGPTPGFTFYLSDKPVLCQVWKDAANPVVTPADPPAPKIYSQQEMDAAVSAATAPVIEELGTEHAYEAELETELAAAQAALTAAQGATVDAVNQARADDAAAQILAIAQQQALAGEHWAALKATADDLLLRAQADVAAILSRAPIRRTKVLAALEGARAAIKALA